MSQVDLREEKEEVGKSERLDAFMKKAAMECGVNLTEVIQHVVDTRLKEIRRDCLRKRKKPEETTVVIEDDEEVEEAGEEESEEEIEEGVNEDEENEGEETEEKENEGEEINQGGENAEEVVGEEQKDSDKQNVEGETKGEEKREVEAEEVEAGAENEKGETGNEHLQEVVNENSGFGEHVESRDDDGVSFTSPERPIPSVSGQGQVPSATKKAETPLINKTAAPSVNSPVNVTQVPVTPPFKNQPAHGSPKIVQTQPSKQPQPRKQPQPKQRTQPTKQPTSGPKRASSRIHALGEFDVILPEMPTVDDCFMHYFMTMEAAPRITTDVQI